MAEYYPLISRAVAGLRDGTPEARRAIYDRARQALVNQLRNMKPPIPEEAIQRETTALDDAVARVEAEVAPARSQSGAPAPVDPPAQPAGPSTPPPIEAPATPAPDNKAPPPPKPVPLAAATTSPSSPRPQPPVVPQRPAPPALSTTRPPVRPSTLPVRPSIPPLRPSAARPSAPVVKPDAPVEPVIKPEAPVEPTVVPVPETPREPEAAPTAPTPPVLPTAPVLKVPTNAPSDLGGPSLPSVTPDSSGSDFAGVPAARIDDDIPRPAAPRRPVERERPNLRIWIVAVAALAAVVAVAFTAWRLRDNPEEMSRAAPIAKSAEPAAAGKIVERATGSAGSAATPATGPAPAATTATDAPAAPAPAETANSTPAPAQPTPDPSIPIAYKAAILVDAPDEPQKVKTYVGTVVWRMENVNEGQNQMLGTGVHADIDIPDAKVQISLEMRKNLEPQFPASHTIELKFTMGADSPLGVIKQIDVLQARREDMPTGDPLSGVPVTITKNYFLVGLTRGDAEAHNLDLLKTRAWFDIPMILDNGKAAKVTFEKGTAGDKIVNDALQAWASGNAN